MNRKVFTTRPGPDAVVAAGAPVKHNFTANAPNQLWVTDPTYVSTRPGMAYVCFIADAFSAASPGGGWRPT